MTLQLEQLTAEIDGYLKRLFPITRSITGEGNRETLRILQELVPLEIKEYPSGTQVYDWTIPEEWNVKDAWIKDENGNKLIDFNESNLHLVGYSEPVHKQIAFSELKKHLYTHPELPDAIPYRTSYYKRDWGFCMTQAQYKALEDADGLLEIFIDSGFNPSGSLSIGELLIQGKSNQEILISTYICHPSMANDNLSGLLTTAFVARELLKNKNIEKSYRIIWVPETIGAITYLLYNEEKMKKVECGFVVTCCGGLGQHSFKNTFKKTHIIDRAVLLAFRDKNIEPWIRPFAPDGSDERQYSMPAFRIPVCTISKDKYYDYKYYHTSLDNLDFVKSENILSSFCLYMDSINIVEKNFTYKSLMPYCEAQLGRRGLYPETGGGIKQKNSDPSIESQLDAITWLMFLADGDMDMLTIAEKSEQPFDKLNIAAKKLIKNGLLEKII